MRHNVCPFKFFKEMRSELPARSNINQRRSNTMATRSHSTVVGVFEDHQQAQRAVNELRRMGFTEDQIGVARRDSDEDRGTLATPTDAGDETYAGEGTAAGLATGAGVGALWGLGIIAGVLPAVGPAIAGGTLAAILSSAAAGAVAAGLGGALIGLGLSKEEADYYNTEFESGRTVVTVTAVGREQEAESILREYGGYDVSREAVASEGVTGEGMGDQGMTGWVGEGRRSGTETLGSGMAGMGTAAASTGSTAPNAWMSGEGTTTAGMTSESESTAMRHPERVSGSSSMSSSKCDTGSMHHEGEQRMTAYEEKLAVDKRSVDKGDVNVRKEVHTEHKTIDVPVHREEVVIERRAPTGETTGSIGEHQEIRIPVREEEVHVEKVPVAKEEVVVGKRKIQDTQHVRETLRKEDIKVDADPDVPVRNRRNET
jgi:uncharacterized protein (TIGR02271 family)